MTTTAPPTDAAATPREGERFESVPALREQLRSVDYLSDEGIAGIVYLTDLEGPEPDETDVPTLWLSTTTKVAQTGRTVAIH
jgi:hypothetical protein